MQYMRIVEKLNPKVFAIENVPEVLTACDGSYYAAVQEKAESFGYELVSSIVQDWKVGGYTTASALSSLAAVSESRLYPALALSMVCTMLAMRSARSTRHGRTTAISRRRAK